MIAVLNGTVTALDADGIHVRSEGETWLVTIQVPADDTGLVVGDRIEVSGGPDPKQAGVWLSSQAHVTNKGVPPVAVPVTTRDLPAIREQAARGEPTIFTRSPGDTRSTRTRWWWLFRRRR